ncbi:MAG: alanine--glyoxylate aminotransferase family protein [Deltaproteobacteria bacterium]|nr:alanine--glyoxylate aminotransferase family protein [Deltaproteobacteria bacterium]
MLNKPRLLTPGPTPLPEEVRLALARDMIHHRKADFEAVMAEVQTGLRELFGTAQPVLVLSASGTGAMVAAATNLFAPGERVLVVEGGKFGERWSDIALSHGLEVSALPVDWGKPVDLEDVENCLDRWPDIRGVLVQASETSTGVLHPIRELAALVRKKDILLIVDGISAVGISPCPMDEWGVDCLLTGSQKGLMLPPGLAFLSLSPRAWERAERIKPKNFYFNLLNERSKLAKNQTGFTSSINLVVGLQACLRLFQDHGLPAIYRKQWALTRMARAGAEIMGLDLLAPVSFTWGLTSILLPPGIDGRKVLALAAKDWNVIMAGGQDRLQGRIVRLGHMGHVDWSDVLAGVHALHRSIMACGGHCGVMDVLDRTMAAYETALAEPLPDTGIDPKTREALGYRSNI